MFRTLKHSLFIFVVILVSACDESPITAPSPLACYTLSLGTWSDGLPEPLPPPPSSLQLTDSLGTSVLENGRRIVRSMPAGSVKAYPFQYWTPREEGDVFVVFSNGFTGMTLDLAPEGDDLHGTARAFFDFGTFDLTAPVQLTRRACE